MGHKDTVNSLLLLSDGRIVSRNEDVFGRKIESLLWSMSSSAELGQVWSHEEFSWKDISTSANVVAGRMKMKVAHGYSIENELGHSVVGVGLGRIFVDEAVDWVVKSGEFVIVFEVTGGAHFFEEVSRRL